MARMYHAGYIVAGDYVLADDTIYQVLEVTQEAEGVVSFWSVSIVTGIGQYLYFPRYTDITACLHIYAK
jgi:hypothetical protein